MQSITSILLTAGGIVALSFFGFVTLSLALVVAGLLSITLVARALMMPQPKPVPVRARTAAGRRVTRVWNDGKGTIIDM